jgi:hypothetical protein
MALEVCLTSIWCSLPALALRYALSDLAFNLLSGGFSSCFLWC